MNAPLQVLEQILEECGSDLGLRIPARLAAASQMSKGTRVRIEVLDCGFFVGIVGGPRLTLAQKLDAFDPKLHGGEVIVNGG